MPVDLGYNIPSPEWSYAKWAFGMYMALHAPVTILQLYTLWIRRKHRFIAFRGMSSQFWVVLFSNCAFYCLLALLSSNPQCDLSLATYVFFVTALSLLVVERRLVTYYLVLNAKQSQKIVMKELGVSIRSRNSGFSRTSFAPDADCFHSCHLTWSNFVFNLLQKNRKTMLESRSKVFSIPKVICLLSSGGITALAYLAFVSASGDGYPSPPPSTWTDICMINTFEAVRVVVVFVGIGFAGFGMLLYRIRGHRDNLYIAKENRWCMILIAIVFLPNLIAAIVPRLYWTSQTTFYVHWVLFNVLPMEAMLFIESFALSRWIDIDVERYERHLACMNEKPSSGAGGGEIRRTRRVPSLTVESRDNYFEKALEDDKLQIQFERFLVQEFSVENLLLYRAAMALEKRMQTTIVHRNSSPDEFLTKVAIRKKDFCAFYEVFFTEDSKLEVNVPSGIKSALQKVFENVSKVDPSVVTPVHWETCQEEMSKAVSDCRDEIFQLMKKDSFNRFKQTEGFKRWKATLEEEDHKQLGYVVPTDDPDEVEKALSPQVSALQSYGSPSISRVFSEEDERRVTYLASLREV
eukprot:TRINITY_DN7765_c0_g1_i4.p1 TRINITY_DN7765_c0_g1~~TRINITY_DN7765_c0_g1_i4.p1  ORF type:complete len:577 (+),score=140.87 TRINITY_DN7765_c0_g1_i4:187-1917(+)